MTAIDPLIADRSSINLGRTVPSWSSISRSELGTDIPAGNRQAERQIHGIGAGASHHSLGLLSDILNDS